MISLLSVIADLATHHGRQLSNEMPASFTVNAKRPAVRTRAIGSLPLRAHEEPATPSSAPESRIAPRNKALGGGDWTAHGVFFGER